MRNRCRRYNLHTTIYFGLQVATEHNDLVVVLMKLRGLIADYELLTRGDVRSMRVTGWRRPLLSVVWPAKMKDKVKGKIKTIRKQYGISIWTALRRRLLLKRDHFLYPVCILRDRIVYAKIIIVGDGTITRVENVTGEAAAIQVICSSIN